MRLAAPLYVVWETTLDCNAKCIHCYSDASFGRAQQRGLPTPKALEVIDQLAEAGVLILAFSGGEPLLREDWALLASHAVSKGMHVSIATNGLAVNERVAKELAKIGVQNISVSIDGDNAATHEAVRRIPGIFEAACSAVTRLRAQDLRVTVNFTPMRLNFKQALGVIDLAQRLGANKVNLTEYVYLSRGGLDLMLQPEELKEVVELWIAESSRRELIEVDWHDCRVALLLPPEEAKNYTGCGAGYTHCRITLAGDVTPCVVLPMTVGNLNDQDFKDIWRNSKLLAQIRNRENIREGNCSSCEHKATCGGCRAISYAASGHPFSGDPTCWINPELASSS